MSSTADRAPRARLPFHVLAKPFGAFCNLECAYCFYLRKRGMLDAGGRMDDATLEAFTRSYIAAQPDGVREVEFAWQGGEPLLAGLDFFRRALELQRRHARPGLAIRNALQTNGTLLDDAWAEFLAANGFLVGVSLDGPRELHDAWRVDHDGRPSHERVLRGLRVLRRHGVEFNTLTVVHRANQGEPQRVYDHLFEQGSRFLQFIPLVEPLGDGRASERSVEPRAYGEFLCGVFDRWLARRHVAEVFVRDFDAYLASLLGVPGATCVSSPTCGRCVAIERSGDVFACDHYVDWAHHLGNVREHGWDSMLDDDVQAGFGLDKSRRLPSACRRCEHLRACWGGCPKDRFATTRDGEPGLNYLCEGYARFFARAAPVMQRMASCLRAGRLAAEWATYDARPSTAERNDPCPCGSGRKHKRCCGR